MTDEKQPGTKQVLLAFQRGAKTIHPGEHERLFTSAYRPFFPRGLMLWGSTDETLVHRIFVGNRSEVEISGTAVPGRYFEMGMTFEQIQRLADVGELVGALGPRLVFELSEALPGVQIGLDISGPYRSACLWGETYTGSGPAQKLVVDHVSGSFVWSGRLIERRLGGDEVAFVVEAPSAEIAAQLLTTFGRREPGR